MIRPKEYAISGWLEARARVWHEEMDRGEYVRHGIDELIHIPGCVDAMHAILANPLNFPGAIAMTNASRRLRHAIKSRPNL